MQKEFYKNDDKSLIYIKIELFNSRKTIYSNKKNQISIHVISFYCDFSTKSYLNLFNIFIL